MAGFSRLPIDIVDVRKHAVATNPDASPLRDDILKGLSMPVGEKYLPTMLLYDERGLRLYDSITTEAPEYYLFPAEEEILKRHGDDIVRFMHAPNSGKVGRETVIELGAGCVFQIIATTVPLRSTTPSLIGKYCV